MNTMFRESLAAIPEDVVRMFEIEHIIAEKIDAALKAKGITKRQFARSMGKSESEVSRWLTGRHNFTLSTIAKIEVALGERLFE